MQLYTTRQDLPQVRIWLKHRIIREIKIIIKNEHTHFTQRFRIRRYSDSSMFGLFEKTWIKDFDINGVIDFLIQVFGQKSLDTTITVFTSISD